MELNPIKAYMDSLLEEGLLIENKKYDLNHIEWKPSTDGPKELNPIVYIKGKMYRPRVETLVFNKEGKVLCINNTPPTKFGTTYYLPGGGFSKEREPIKQAYKECQEEAKINITNIKDTGLVQIADFHGNYPDWHKKKLWPMGIKYEGSVTLIFVADYKSPYKGYIREIDKDDFYKSAKFVDPDEVKWIPEHKQAVEFYKKSLHENAEVLDEGMLDMTLYHGSYLKLKKLEPNSINLGNKLEKPKWSIFLWRNKDIAIGWALFVSLKRNYENKYGFKSLSSGRRPIMEFDSGKYHYVIKEQFYDEMEKFARGLKAYVYSVSNPFYNVRFGNTVSQPEFSIDNPIEYNKREEIIIMDKLFEKYFTPVTESEYKRIFESFTTHNARGLFRYIYHDQNEITDKMAFLYTKLKYGHIKPGDDLEEALKDYKPGKENWEKYKIPKTTNEGYEYYELLDEESGYKPNPVFFSEDDIYINFDKFKTGVINSLLLVGLSGSGKSTLGKKLAEKYNAYYVGIDVISFKLCIYQDKANWEYIKENDKYLYQFFKEKNLPPTCMLKYDYQGIKKNEIIDQYIKWLCFERKDRNINKIIIEGGDVAIAISHLPELKEFPIIFKGTSILKSVFRRFCRSSRKGYIFAIKNAIDVYIKQYSKMIPEVNTAREKVMDQEYEYKNEATIISDPMNKIQELYNTLCKYQYGYVVNGKKITDTGSFSDYTTLSPDDFHKYKIGVCWDYAEAEARFFSKLGFKLTLNKQLENNTYSLYFIQYASKDGFNPTHTWLAFKYDNKIYTFEVSWNNERGIKQWNSEKLMVDTYFKKHVNGNHEPENPMKYVMIKYGPRRSFNKTSMQYMNSIYHTGYVINTNIKEFTTNKHITLNESAIEFVPMNNIKIIEEENNVTNLEKAKYIGIDTNFLESTILKKNVLPIDTSSLKLNQAIVCANTHNINAFLILKDIISNDTFNFSSYIDLGKAWAEQLFARDFMLVDKNKPDYFSDEFEGFKVRSINDGKVILVKKMYKQYGNCICIEHPDINSISTYCHLKSDSFKVKQGDIVKAGQVIGLVGNTGNSTVAHLHFQMTNPKFGIGKYLDGFDNYKYIDLDIPEIWNKDMSLIIKKMDNKYKINKDGNLRSMCLLKESVTKESIIIDTLNEFKNKKIKDDFRPNKIMPLRDIDQIYKDGKANCVDIAYCLHDICKHNNIDHTIGNVKWEFNKNKSHGHVFIVIKNNNNYTSYHYFGDTRTIKIIQKGNSYLECVKLTGEQLKQEASFIPNNVKQKEYIYSAKDLNKVDHRNRLAFNQKDFIDLLGSSNTSYQDALSIYIQLSDEERDLAFPRGRFTDSPYLAARAIQYANNKPIGFMDAYDLKLFGKNTKKVFLILAILPKYRKKGIAKKLLDEIYIKLKENNYTHMIWRCDKRNIASAKCAEKLGFTLYKQTKDEFTYIKKI